MRSDDWLEETSEGILLRLQVQPRASRTELVGLHGVPPRLKIRLAAPPVDGEANEELLAFLKTQLRISAKQLRLLRGHASKSKDVVCSGLTLSEVRQRLGL